MISVELTWKAILDENNGGQVTETRLKTPMRVECLRCFPIRMAPKGQQETVSRLVNGARVGRIVKTRRQRGHLALASGSSKFDFLPTNRRQHARPATISTTAWPVGSIKDVSRTGKSARAFNVVRQKKRQKTQASRRADLAIQLDVTTTARLPP
jgi:hypothetical protein